MVLGTIAFIETEMASFQVTIGSSDLKANHAIDQVVEVVSEHDKYPKYVHSEPIPDCIVQRHQCEVYALLAVCLKVDVVVLADCFEVKVVDLITLKM
jgi:hypothetical protein